MKCGIYVRVSTVGQKDNYSVAVQKSRGQIFCKENGFVPVLYEEQASGASLFRQEFQKLLKAVENKTIEAIWVIEFSRLSRDEEDAIYLRKLFVKHSIKLYIDGQLTDLTRPESVFVFQINSAVSSYERSRTRERIGRGIHKRIDDGMSVYGQLYGYDYKFDTAGKRHIVINQKEAKVIKRLFHSYDEGWSYSRLCKMLWDEGITGKKGKRWWAITLSGVFHRPIYCGYQYNTKKELIKSNIYPPIITVALWKRVQRHISKNIVNRDKAYRQAKHELSNVIKCGDCGTGFYRTHSVKIMKGGRRYIKNFYQHLFESKKAHNCNQHPRYLNNVKIEQLMRALYVDCFTNDAEIKKFIHIQEKDVHNERKALDSKVGTIEERLAELEKQRQRLFSLVRAGVAETTDISTQVEEVNQERKALEKRLAEATASIRAKEANIDDLIEEFKMTEGSWNFYDLNDVQRRELYLRRIKSCTLNGYTLTVTWITGKVDAVDTKNIPEDLQARMRTIDNLIHGTRV
jgi:site-specific DNA recombinase